MATALDSQTQAIPITLPQQVVQRSLALLERQVDDAIASRPHAIDLVLASVQIIDSTGLNWLNAIRGRLETLNIRLRLVNPSGIVADALIATRLDARFTIQNTQPQDTAGGTHGRS